MSNLKTIYHVNFYMDNGKIISMATYDKKEVDNACMVFINYRDYNNLVDSNIIKIGSALILVSNIIGLTIEEGKGL